MTVARGRLFVVLTVVLTGCASLVPGGPAPTEVSGRTDGYTPTASFLKVFVRGEDGNLTLADFDRREWHVAKIAEDLDARRIPHLSARGTSRETLGEVVIEEVLDPAGLSKLSYAAMSPTPEDRRLYDLQYDEIVKRFASATRPAVATPTLPLG